MAKGFQKGDPRARLAGRKGGKASASVRVGKPDAWFAGYDAGWRACERWWRRQRGAA